MTLAALGRRGITQGAIGGAIFWIVLVLIGYPLVFVILLSMSERGIGSPLTINWFVDVATSESTRRALANTGVVVAGSLGLALPIGTAIAFLTSRTDVPGARVIGGIALLPFLISPFITAVGWTVLASPQVGLLNEAIRALGASAARTGPLDVYTIGGIIWVSSLYLMPYVYIFTSGAFSRLDGSLEESGRVSGGGPLTVFRTISLPLMAPAILGAALVVAVISAGQFVIPEALGTPKQIDVMGTLVYVSMSQFPARAELAAALGFVVSAFGILCLVGQRYLLSRGSFATISARGFRPHRVSLGTWRYAALAVCVAYITVAIVLPVGAVVLMSLVSYWTTPVTWQMFTLENYRYMFVADPVVWSAVRNSTILAVSAASIAVALCLVASWFTVRTGNWAGRLTAYLMVIPLGVPGIVMALGVLNAWIRPPVVLYGTVAILVVGMLAAHLPVSSQATTAALRQVDPVLEESARVAGSSWPRTLFRITFPILRDSLIGAWLIMYVLVLRDISVSILLYTPKNPLFSIFVLDALPYSPSRLAAYCILLLVVTVVPVLLWRQRGAFGREETVVAG